MNTPKITKLSDPVDRLIRAAREASGYLDLGMKKKAFAVLDKVLLNDKHFDCLYEKEVEDESLSDYLMGEIQDGFLG